MKKIFKSLSIVAIALTFTFLGARVIQAAPSYVFQRSIIPETNDTYYLGSTSPNAEWNGIYTKNLTVTGTCIGCGSSGGASSIATSSNETSGYIPFWTTTAATPAKLGADSNLFWDNTNKRLGVGNSSPNQTVDIVGSSNSGQMGIKLTNTAVGNAGVNFEMNGDYSQFVNDKGAFYITNNDAAGTIIFRPYSSNETARFTSTGLGIGTNNPQQLLHIGNGAMEIGSPDNTAQSFATRATSTLFTRNDLPTSYYNKISNSWSGLNAGNTMNFEVTNGSSVTNTILSLRGDGNIQIGSSTGNVLISNNNQALSIANNSATARFRLLPFGSDIYFDNTIVGNTYFRSNTDTSPQTNMTILSNGNVGIGTTTPWKNLSITGDQAITGNFYKTDGGTTVNLNLNNKSSTSFPATDFNYPSGGIFRAGEVSIAGTNDVFFQALPATSAGYGYFETWAGAGTIIGTGNSTPILFKPNRTEKMRLTSSGNLGIGNSSPGELLTLGTSGTTKGVLSFAGNTSGKVIIQPAAAAGSWTLTLPTSAGTNGYSLTTDGSGVTSWTAPQWTTSGSDIYYTAGKVGVNTSSLSYPLNVSGVGYSGVGAKISGDATQGIMILDNGSGSGDAVEFFYDTKGGFQGYNRTNSDRTPVEVGGYTLAFKTGGSFHGSGGGTYDNALLIDNSHNVSVTNNFDSQSYSVQGNGGANCTDNSVNTLNGLVTSCGTYSDARLKTATSTLSNVLQFFDNRLTVYSYKYNNTAAVLNPRISTTTTYYGVMAQDLVAAGAPYSGFVDMATTTFQDPNNSNATTTKAFYSVNYGRFIAILLEAVKELKSFFSVSGNRTTLHVTCVALDDQTTASTTLWIVNQGGTSRATTTRPANCPN